jgi:hypothetical protein
MGEDGSRALGCCWETRSSVLSSCQRSTAFNTNLSASDSKPKPKRTDFGELEARKRVLTRIRPEGIAGVSCMPETLPLITRGSGWCDKVLDGEGWVGDVGLLLGDKIFGVV